MILFLIGYRATGKTTVGKLLAEQFQLDWVDSDRLIQKRSGRTISEIFQSDGEGFFRDLETEALQEICSQAQSLNQSLTHSQTKIGQIASLGGGAILREQNRQLIKGAGKAIWLRASAETVWQRLCQDEKTESQRPSLSNLEGLAEVNKLLTEREPVYAEVADFEIDTDRCATPRVIEKISELPIW